MAKTNRSLIRLICTTHELTLLDPFTETRMVDVDPLEVDYPFDRLLMWPYLTPEEKELLPIDKEQVPSGELAVSERARVRTSEGEYVGCVDAFLVNTADECITHLAVYEGHPWNPKEVRIPVSQVARMSGETVDLKLDRRQIAVLPAIPMRWRGVA